jgi:hypothetical protein
MTRIFFIYYCSFDFGMFGQMSDFVNKPSIAGVNFPEHNLDEGESAAFAVFVGLRVC